MSRDLVNVDLDPGNLMELILDAGDQPCQVSRDLSGACFRVGMVGVVSSVEQLPSFKAFDLPREFTQSRRSSLTGGHVMVCVRGSVAGGAWWRVRSRRGEMAASPEPGMPTSCERHRGYT
ncbi:hypothetical protein E2C01_001876 [Portunus trituberculatus]|uniref:Uncharacterized protein n=1 Tax=Portunus trituberculatus TaxID=210409 RepID=A0A5B7CHW1_PORTR|nr:hypothetical protein [Portunus trituberculatus]